MPQVDRRNLLPGAAAFAAALLVALLGRGAGADEPGPNPESERVQLQLLGVNDFHGHLEPPQPGVGGAAWLGAWLNRAATSHPDRTIRVHTGDMVGASPLISSHFNDEPTIDATNHMGFDVGTPGNHEFDEGGAEALRLVRRARYPYIAANTEASDGGDLILPPYKIVERAGVKVGFIGVATTDTPYFLLSEYAREFNWTDLSDAVNRYVPDLQRQGVQAIVVLAHAGAFQQGADAAGEVVNEARQMSDAVDVVVAGHTHSRLDLEVDGKLVVEALSYGVAFDRVNITVERAAPLANRVVGYTDRRLDNEAVDRLAVEAQRAFTGADLAFLNPGNTRSDIAAGPITYADAFEVQAYEHPVWRMHMLGADLIKAQA